MAKAQKLTAVLVAKKKPTDVRQEIPDKGRDGLRLVIHPTGKKSWSMRFRRPNGKAGNLTLGDVDTSDREDHAPTIGKPLTLAGARVLAAQIDLDRKRDIDIVAQQRVNRQRRQMPANGDGNLFPAMAKMFVAERVKKNGQRPKGWRSEARYLGLEYKGDEPPTIIKGSIAAKWEDRPVASITDDDLYQLIDGCRRDGVPGMKKTGHALSDARGRHMADAVAAMFKWLREHRRVPVNLAITMYKPKPGSPRDRCLTGAKEPLDALTGKLDIVALTSAELEIKSFWRACDQLGDPFGPMLKLLLLTGCRLREIAMLEDRELMSNECVIKLPGHRTKNGLPHNIPLSPLAKSILDGVRRVPNCRFVFSTNGRTAVSGFSKLKIKIDSLMPAFERPWSFHCLRRTCSSGLGEMCGTWPHVVESCINHRSGARRGVAGDYNLAEYWSERVAAFNRWSDYVAWLVA